MPHHVYTEKNNSIFFDKLVVNLLKESQIKQIKSEEPKKITYPSKTHLKNFLNWKKQIRISFSLL